MERNDSEEVVEYLRDRRRRPESFDLVLRTYSAFGLLIAGFALVYFALTLLPYDLSSNQQLALIITGVGVTLSLLSRGLLMVRKDREKENEKFVFFLDSWARFEATSRDALRANVERINSHPPERLIEELYDRSKINSSDRSTLKEALEMRNLIVHGGPRRLRSPELVGQFTPILTDIIKKISQPV